ncbi:MAG: flagellar biosynthetic protein FliQ [candidate division Zixibacteria bacterium CG_4_9_14_3_um_filter_46_8]|nr:MAG: flagellar biosynthetic protein FliQ [candidate division Zixibacteria bacterium CG_4_9_14_3_um_filter_46_8]
MDMNYVLTLGREAITLTLLVSAPMLISGLVVGLIVSIFQAVTQINEMTLTFIPKIVAVAIALLLFLPWMINMILDFMTRMFGSISTLAH